MDVTVVIAGLNVSDGGPSYSVPRLAEALSAGGVKPAILAVGRGNPAELAKAEFFSQDLGRWPILASLRFSADLKRALYRRAQSADLLHVHGLWLMPNLYAGWAANHARKPLVVSPRGMVAPAALAFSKAKKALFWRLLQGPAYSQAALWHATSAAEAVDIRAFGIAAPIAVIPNGIDLPQSLALHAKAADCRTILFMSRLHPKKNLPNLLEAWRRIAGDHRDWQLVVAGPDERGHSAELEAQVANLAIPRVQFAGPVYGAAKDALLIGADLFVLPTRNENFGIAVAEALAAGVPAIVTKGAPWQGLATERAGWWIDDGVPALEAALRDAVALPADERRAMGLRGRAWMAREFDWDRIASDMISSYEWVRGSGDRPACVLTD